MLATLFKKKGIAALPPQSQDPLLAHATKLALAYQQELKEGHTTLLPSYSLKRKAMVDLTLDNHPAMNIEPKNQPIQALAFLLLTDRELNTGHRWTKTRPSQTIFFATKAPVVIVSNISLPDLTINTTLSVDISQDRIAAVRWTSLHQAAYKGFNPYQQTPFDLEDVNVKAAEGFTPLLIAASNRQLEVAQFLLDHHADSNAQNKLRQTALHLATQQQDVGMVQLLLAYQADRALTNYKGQTPLMIAQHLQNAELIKLLNEQVVFKRQSHHLRLRNN